MPEEVRSTLGAKVILIEELWILNWDGEELTIVIELCPWSIVTDWTVNVCEANNLLKVAAYNSIFNPYETDAAVALWINPLFKVTLCYNNLDYFSTFVLKLKEDVASKLEQFKQRTQDAPI